MISRASTVYLFGEFELRSDGPSLLRNGQSVPAEPKVLEVLVYLAANSARIVSKAELLDSIWKDLTVVDGVVHRCVSQARRLVGDSGPEYRVLATRHRSGYQFVARHTTTRTVSRGAGTPHENVRIIGRAAELRSIEAVLDDLFDRRCGRVFCLAAGAGQGKTRLLAALADEAQRRGARILHASCREVSGAPPMRPWIQVLEELAHGEDGASLIGRLGPRAAILSEILPIDAGSSSAQYPASATSHAPTPPHAPAASTDIERSRFLAAAELLVRLASEGRPTVIAIDDLHCADESTLVLWHMLTRSCARVPFVLACAYREEEARQRGVLRAFDAEAFTSDQAVRLELAGLTREETELLVAPLLEPGSGEAGRIHERSQGNPFFALELAKHFARNPAGNRDSLPQGIKAVASLGLDTLDNAARSLLRIAAVAGRDIDPALLRAVSGETSVSLDEALDEAVLAGIVEPADAPDRYRFRHILLRDVLYDEIAPAARRRIHRAIAEHLRGSQAADRHDELAHHYLEAAPDGFVSEAVDSAVAAAEHATGRFAFEAAARSYEQASTALSLAVSRSEARLCVLDLERGDSWSRAGDDAKATEAYREAARRASHLGEPDLLARAAIGLTARFGQPVDFQSSARESHAFLEQALAALPDEPSPRRAIVLACLAFSAFGVDAAAAGFAARSEAEARACDDGYATCVALVAQHLVALEPGNLSRAAAIADELIAAAEKSGIEEMILAGQTYRVFRCLEESTGEALDGALAARRESALRWPQPQATWWSHTLDAAVGMMRGDWQGCEEHSREARLLASRSENSNLELAYNAQRSQVLIHRGEFSEAMEISRASAAAYPHLHAGVAACHALMAALGERTESVAFAAQWRGRELVSSLQASNWLFEANCLAELAYQVRDAELAAPLYDFLRPLGDRNVVVGQGIAYSGPVARMLGLLGHVLGRFDEAVRHFEHARVRAGEFGALPWLARIDIDCAKMLRERNVDGDSERARGLLDKAAALAERTGAVSMQLEIAMLQ